MPPRHSPINAMAISSLSEQTGAGPGRLKKGAICSHIGKLGETSTDFEVLCRKSARNRGIDRSEPVETASETVHGIQHM